MFLKTPVQTFYNTILYWLLLFHGVWATALVYGATTFQHTTARYVVHIGPFAVNSLEKHTISSGGYTFRVHFLSGFTQYELLSITVSFIVAILYAIHVNKHNQK